MKRVRVTFAGFEPFWMRVAVDGLMKRYADELDCRWMLWPSTPRERIRFLGALLTSDEIIRLGMPFEFESETNRLFLAILRIFGRPVGVNYWMGSDARAFEERATRGQLTERDREAVRLLHHFAGTEYLGKRLREVGVPAVDAELIGPERDIPPEMPPFPAQFSVLTYWSDTAFEFAGGPAIFDAARQMADVPFHVMGTCGVSSWDAPANVTCHGRVEDVLPLIAQSVVSVRLVGWDALPSSFVEESLLMGRHVIYSQDWPNTIHIDPADTAGLVAALRQLRARHAAGDLPLNAAGREFTRQDSNPDAQAAAMRSAILGALGRPTANAD